MEVSPKNAHRRLALIVAAVLAILLVCAQAEEEGALPQYQPQQEVSETIRSWGSAAMAGLMKSWEQGFRAYHPEVRFSDTLKGSETAQAGLYLGVADLALSSREILPGERYGLVTRKRHQALEITVATGSYDVPNKTFALAVFVHRDNPLTQLTLKQLDGIFGEQRDGGWDVFVWRRDIARGPERNIRTWGQLGLTGEWADKSINAYGYPLDLHYPAVFAPGARLFFGRVVLHGADKWTPTLVEFEKTEEITQALSGDRYGIAYAGMNGAPPQIKPLALAADGGTYVAPIKATVASRKYPLTRSTYIYIDRTPGQPLDPKVREFLRYVLSREGQQAVARDGGYLPLTADVARAQLEKLK